MKLYDYVPCFDVNDEEDSSKGNFVSHCIDETQFHRHKTKMRFILYIAYFGHHLRLNAKVKTGNFKYQIEFKTSCHIMAMNIATMREGGYVNNSTTAFQVIDTIIIC